MSGWLVALAWIVLGLSVMSVLGSPWLVGTTRNRSLVVEQFLFFLLLLPLCGHVIGWW